MATPYTPDELAALVLAARQLALAKVEAMARDEDKGFRSGTERGIIYGRSITPETLAGLWGHRMSKDFGY
jgi:hypothetical protein